MEKFIESQLTKNTWLLSRLNRFIMLYLDLIIYFLLCKILNPNLFHHSKHTKARPVSSAPFAELAKEALKVQLCICFILFIYPPPLIEVLIDRYQI